MSIPKRGMDAGVVPEAAPQRLPWAEMSRTHAPVVQLVFAPSMVPPVYETIAESMYPPLGILYLAAALREQIPGIAVHAFDGAREGYEATTAAIDRVAPDVLGVSFCTMQTQGAARLCRAVKRYRPSTLVVIGGPHATALPLESLRDTGADLCVVGEGERPMVEIVARVARGATADELRDIPGVWSLDGGDDGGLIAPPPGPTIEPVDSIPFPARDLLDHRAYTGWYISRRQPEGSILLTRGCNFRCTYCSNAVWQCSTPSLRAREPEAVVDELEQMQRDQGIREFYDQSDEFNHELDYGLAFCEAVRRRDLGLTWKVALRARPFDDELARAMVDAGCWCANIGIESGNDDTLRGIRKAIGVDDVWRTCEILRRHGIVVRGLFMLYNVWEERGELRFEDSAATLRTIDLARRLFEADLLQYVTCTVTMPFPGSPLYDIATRHDLINPRYLRRWDIWLEGDAFIMDLPGIGPRERTRVKRRGEILRARCLLRNGGYKLKDVPLLARRGLQQLRNNLRQEIRGR